MGSHPIGLIHLLDDLIGENVSDCLLGRFYLDILPNVNLGESGGQCGQELFERLAPNTQVAILRWMMSGMEDALVLSLQLGINPDQLRCNVDDVGRAFLSFSKGEDVTLSLCGGRVTRVRGGRRK